VHDAAAGVVEGEEGVGGRGADRRLIAGAQHAVDEAGNDGGVQTVLKKELGDVSVIC